MRFRSNPIIIEYYSENLEIEQKLVSFIEEELNGVLIGNKAWKCRPVNSSWSFEHIKTEIAWLVKDDPKGAAIWINRKSPFRFKDSWLHIVINSGQERFYKVDPIDMEKRFESEI